MKQRNEKGIAHLGVIIAALVVTAAVAFGGWYVWQKNGDDKTDKSNDSQGNNSQSNKESTDPSEEGKYLVIKEWGVRFELPEELKGDLLTYESNTEASGTVLFASKRLNAMAGDNSCNLVLQPDGSYSGGVQANLARINPETYPKDFLETYKQGLDYIKKLGNYDYYSSKMPANKLTCATAIGGDDPIPGLYDAEEKISKQLREAFMSLEKN